MLYLELGHDEAWRDVEGRPLGERACRPEQLVGVPMKMIECPYPGLRFRHANKMNASALKQIVAHWSDSMGVLASIRSLYQGYCASTKFDYWDVWRIATMALAWPGYLIHRSHAPISSDSLPVVSATAFKIAKGIAPVAQRLAFSEMLTDDTHRPVSGEELHAFAEKHGEFLGSDEVCAGPDDLVQEALGLLFDGRVGQHRPQVSAASQMGAELTRYAVTQANVEIVDYVYRLMRTLALHDFRLRVEGAGAGSPAVAQAFGPAFASMLKGDIATKACLLPPSERFSKLERLAPLVLEDAAFAARWPLDHEVRALLGAWEQPAIWWGPPLELGRGSWVEALEELWCRMHQLDAALLRAYHQLCGRLRDALGHEERPPRGELNERLIDQRHGPQLRQAMEALAHQSRFTP
jgi:hypothetical protein